MLNFYRHVLFFVFFFRFVKADSSKVFFFFPETLMYTYCDFLATLFCLTSSFCMAAWNCRLLSDRTTVCLLLLCLFQKGTICTSPMLLIGQFSFALYASRLLHHFFFILQEIKKNVFKKYPRPLRTTLSRSVNP